MDQSREDEEFSHEVCRTGEGHIGQRKEKEEQGEDRHGCRQSAIVADQTGVMAVIERPNAVEKGSTHQSVGDHHEDGSLQGQQVVGEDPQHR